MAVGNTTAGLISTLTTALESARSAIPAELSVATEGISLLDVKNDLLLSYLQNLAFIIIMRLRHDTNDDSTRDEVVQKLVELRVYLERGVRPLEGKLKYQIDKVVRAAEEAERRGASQRSAPATSKKALGAMNDTKPDGSGESDTDGSDSEDSDATDPAIESSVGPRAAALLRNASIPSTKEDSSARSRASTQTATGTYKPPRINPTSMPELSTTRDRDDRPARKRRSQLLDEYIDEELSTAPQAQPSIGSGGTILQQGRGAMSSRERERERERTDYEERNFTRLPALSKAERKKEKAKTQKDSRDLFGGEDWTGLGGLGDRIHRTVRGGGRRGEGVFERRDKRKRDTIDGPRGDGGGAGIGDTFEKRRKILQQRAEKKGKRRG